MRHFRVGIDAVEHVELTPGELRTLVQVCRGKSDKEIATDRNLSKDTKLVAALLAGLRVQNRTRLLIWALQRPEVFQGMAVPLGLHAPACDCTSPYCVVFRSIPRPDGGGASL